MTAYVFIETQGGLLKPSVLEAVGYAQALGGAVAALVMGVPSAEDIQKIGQSGAAEIICLEGVSGEDARACAHALHEKLSSVHRSYSLVFAQSTHTETIGSLLSVKVDACIVSRVVSLPDGSSNLRVRRSIYTGKAFEEVSLEGERKLLLIQKNITFPPVKAVEAPRIERVQVTTPPESPIRVIREEKAKQEVSLTEADIVVSGGRGLKGPENWHLVEDLAKALGAATACSKPVSDMEWRPHHEHVGQTGIKVSPSLYMALGISGAVQHLAGVNGSRVMVVINKDAEAPFFKAADYGIVGDVFEVLPKLTAAIKQMNA